MVIGFYCCEFGIDDIGVVIVVGGDLYIVFFNEIDCVFVDGIYVWKVYCGGVCSYVDWDGLCFVIGIVVNGYGVFIG